MKIVQKYILLLAGILLTSTVFSQVKVIELKKSGSPKIVVKVRFENGSISDPVGMEGITNLTAALMMDGGTTMMTKNQINDLIYPMAAYYYSNTDKEVTTFTFAFPKDFIDDFYPILAGLILTPTLDESDFNRIKSNTLNYLTQVIRASSDEDFSKFALEEMLFEGTPYAHLVNGTIEGLNSITLADVRAHYENYFTSTNVSIGIAGDFSDDFVKELKEDMESLPNTEVVLPEMPSIPMPDGINVRIVEKEDALGSAVFAGYPIEITRADDDFAALMIANSWLGEHRKSYGQLYSKIRETRSMNYGDYTYIEWYENGGRNQLPVTGVPRNTNYFSIWLRPVQIGDQLKQQYPELADITIGHAHFAMRLAIREMDMLVENGMDKEEFEKTKQFLRSYMKLYIQTPEKELGFLMDSDFYNRKDYIKEMDALLKEVTLEEVNAALRKYFQTDNMDIVIITDDSEAKPLAESFKNNLVSPMSYADQLKAELPEEVLLEDSEVESYPLNVKSVEIISSEEPFVN